MHAIGTGRPHRIEEGSLEEFITEHHWGYTAQEAGCSEYQVEHPKWLVWPVEEAALRADVATLYGEVFAKSLTSPVAAAFIADGSSVIVRHKSELP